MGSPWRPAAGVAAQIEDESAHAARAEAVDGALDVDEDRLEQEDV